MRSLPGAVIMFQAPTMLLNLRIGFYMLRESVPQLVNVSAKLAQ